RDHVGLRELTGLAAGVAGAEASLEILKERGVEINLAVVRAVERPHRGLREPAGRARDAGEHHERRRLVGFAVLRENLLPLRLRARPTRTVPSGPTALPCPARRHCHAVPD